VYDTYGQSKTIANAIVRQGGDSWFFVTVDYAFGLALEQNASEFVKAAGGRVLGSARHPLNGTPLARRAPGGRPSTLSPSGVRRTCSVPPPDSSPGSKLII